MKKLNERLVSSRIGEMPVNGLPGECLEKKEYMPPKTKRTEVEAEGGFCDGSVVTDDNQDKNAVTIEEQEVGTISNYYSDEDGNAISNGWDY